MSIFFAMYIVAVPSRAADRAGALRFDIFHIERAGLDA
jgi:hypothetical protein